MSLTCISCKLTFTVPQLHQQHYKSDWHRYNLKRRLAELPPVTNEEFDKRAAAFKGDVEKKDKVSLHCDSCNKYFSCENVLANHLKSNKHLESESRSTKKTKNINVFKMPAQKSREAVGPVNVDDASNEEWSDEGDDHDWESCDDSGNEDGEVRKIEIDTDECLFCDLQSDSVVNNVSHMTEDHSFFIPNVEYLVDLDRLIEFLAVKVNVYCVCLWCDGKGKGFISGKSVKQHMIDKGHCKILYEGKALYHYAEFYDYSSVNTEEITDVCVVDEKLKESSNDYELVLPSGATLGHRLESIYFKQNLRPLLSDSRQKVKKVLQHYKALGYTGVTGKASVLKARDISYMQRIQNRRSLKLALKHNKFQPHLRPQVIF